VLRSADQARIGETLRLRLADGALRCQVKEKENEHGSKKDV
jgi:exonuclease VII large subunit